MNTRANYVAGDWVEGAATVADLNPSDLSDVIGEFAVADEAQVTGAIDAAVAAAPLWAAATPADRFGALEQIGPELSARADELGAQLAREEGKPKAEGVGEVLRASHIFRFFAGEAVRIPGEHVRSVRPGVDVDVIREPLGGKNPLVVLDDADLAVAVDCATQGAFFQTGQRCTASSRLVVTAGIHDTFVDALLERMRSLRVGPRAGPCHADRPGGESRPARPGPRVPEIGRDEGAELAWGGERLDLDTDGYFLQPALLTGTTNDMRVNREEIFGPIATVVRADDPEHALALADDTEFCLSAGVCTTSLARAAMFRDGLQAGIVTVNLPTAGVDFHVPFGGRKGSSSGAREQGRYAVEFFTTVKKAYIKP